MTTVEAISQTQIIDAPITQQEITVDPISSSVTVSSPESTVSVTNAGPAGPRGFSGIHTGPTAPADTTVVWADTASSASPLGRSFRLDMSNSAHRDYVNSQNAFFGATPTVVPLSGGYASPSNTLQAECVQLYFPQTITAPGHNATNPRVAAFQFWIDPSVLGVVAGDVVEARFYFGAKSNLHTTTVGVKELTPIYDEAKFERNQVYGFGVYAANEYPVMVVPQYNYYMNGFGWTAGEFYFPNQVSCKLDITQAMVDRDYSTVTSPYDLDVMSFFLTVGPIWQTNDFTLQVYRVDLTVYQAADILPLNLS